MLIGGIALGLILGLLAGGSLANLAYDPAALGRAPLRRAHPPVRRRSSCSTRASPSSRPCGCRCWPPSFGLLLFALWANRGVPGPEPGVRRDPVQRHRHHRQRRLHADLGAEPRRRGLTPADVTSAIHIILPPTLDANFLLHLGPLVDVIPIPLPLIQNVASVGDLVPDARASPSSCSPRSSGSRRSSTRRSSRPSAAAGRDGRADATAPRRRSRARRPVSRRHWPRRSPSSARSSSAAPGPGWPRRRSRPSKRTPRRPPSRAHRPSRSRAHRRGRRARPAAPVRPARAQRLVLGALGRPAHLAVRRPAPPARARRRRRRSRPGSALATGLVFFAATLPNLLLSPIAGTFVDRWDHKEVMVVSDILRAAHRPAPPDRGDHQHHPRLPARLPRDDDLDLLPAGARRDPAADRPRGGPAQRQLGDVGRRDDRRRHRLPAGRPVRGAPRDAPSRSRSGSTARPTSPRRRCSRRSSSAAPSASEACRGRTRVPASSRELRAGWQLPAQRDRPAREHAPGRGRPVQRSGSRSP